MSRLTNEPFHWTHNPHPRDAFLMLHGLGGGSYEMRLLGQELHRQGYTVASLNYPGHDKPGLWMPDSTWTQWYQQIEAHYSRLRDTHERVSVVGFSTGCPLALHLAGNYTVDRLVLLSPFLKIRRSWYYLTEPERYVQSLGHVVRQVPRFHLPITDPLMRRQALQAAYFRTFNIQAVRSALELINTVTPTLESIQTPTLIVHSRKDSIVCPSGAELLMQRLGSPIKQVHWLNRSEHIILLDVERDVVTAQILNFITHTQALSC